MISFGIMQGRLTPSNGRGIQFFPFENWQKEFEDCAGIYLDEIEWIFDYDHYENNPLWTISGTKALKNVIRATGVKVRAVCFDYFMRRPFFKQPADILKLIRKENLEMTKRVLDSMSAVGATLLEIPMVDASSVKTIDEKNMVIDYLHDVADMASSLKMNVSCETDMPVGAFRAFLDKIDRDNIYANYDSGNSSGLGYDHREEILSLNEYIVNVHIKDRILNGMSVGLGRGNADFDKVFGTLKDIGYNKSILLQAARGSDGEELNNISSQIAFVKSYCSKYGME